MAHLVVALAYEDLCTFEFGCVVEVFGTSRPELGADWYDFSVHSCDKGPLLRATGGVHLRVRNIRGLLQQAQTIIIPGWRGIDEQAPALLLDQLRHAHARGARICSICSGAFVLAQAGLLDGLRATTHWRYAEALRTRFPMIYVEDTALYIEQGTLTTAAGSAAGLDMMLHLVRRDHGTRVANHVAKRLVLAPHRAGGQSQFLPKPLWTTERDKLGQLMLAVRTALADRHDMDEWATQACVSRRTLQRWFQNTFGMSPVEWLTSERIATARDLLETTQLSISVIGQRCGFGSDESFRAHFRRALGTSPGSYQRSFGTNT